MTALVFWFLAAIAVVASLGVILIKDIFRAALFLILSFFVIAVFYVTLYPDFLAAVQVLVYVGAISILLIFAIMLTREVKQGNLAGNAWLSFVVAALFLVILIFAIVNTPWAKSAVAPEQITTVAIAQQLFTSGGFILPFEIASFLLLSAILGAMAIARER